MTFLRMIVLSMPLTIMSFTAFCQYTNSSSLAANAPEDKPLQINKGQLKTLDSLVKPYVLMAKSTLPAARERYLKGLSKGEVFFLVVRVFDADGKFEQVFVRISEYHPQRIVGTIASEIATVKEYRFGQTISFSEEKVLDWIISKPDGTEEGNFVGKYMDTLH